MTFAQLCLPLTTRSYPNPTCSSFLQGSALLKLGRTTVLGRLEARIGEAALLTAPTKGLLSVALTADVHDPPEDLVQHIAQVWREGGRGSGHRVEEQKLPLGPL